MGKVTKVFSVPSLFTVTAFAYGEELGWMVEFETLDGEKNYHTLEEFYELCLDCRYNFSDDYWRFIGGTE